MSNHLNTLFCQFSPEYRGPYFWSLPWIPFMECWRLAAAAAYELILVEVDGKCQFVVDTRNIVDLL